MSRVSSTSGCRLAGPFVGSDNRRDARLAAAGLDPDTVSTIRGDYMLESGHAAAATLLVANDLMAIGCVQHDSLVEAVAA